MYYYQMSRLYVTVIVILYHHRHILNLILHEKNVNQLNTVTHIGDKAVLACLCGNICNGIVSAIAIVQVYHHPYNK